MSKAQDAALDECLEDLELGEKIAQLAQIPIGEVDKLADDAEKTYRLRAAKDAMMPMNGPAATGTPASDAKPTRSRNAMPARSASS